MDMGAYLYSTLPQSVRERDEVNLFPLKQLCAVLGSGLDGVRSDADNFPGLVNVDTCPAAQLPRLAEMLGFDFPFDLPVDQQRAFVRSTVALYRMKGTPAALKFVVSRVIGNGFALNITNENYATKTFDVELTAVQDAASLAQLESKVIFLVGLYAPAGLVPNIVTVYYYHDTAPSVQRVDTNLSAVQFDAWRVNMKHHTLNTIQANGDIVSCNNHGHTTLTTF